MLEVKKKKDKKQKKKGVVCAKMSTPAVTTPQHADSSNSSFVSGYDPSEFEVIEQQDFEYESDELLKAELEDELHVNSLNWKNNSDKKKKKKKTNPSKNRSQDGKMLLSTDNITTDVSQKGDLQTQKSKKKKKKKDGIQNGKTGPHTETSATKSLKVSTNGISTSSDISKEVYLETHESKKKKNTKNKDGALSTVVVPNNAKASDSKKYSIATEGNISQKNVKSKKPVPKMKKDNSIVDIRGAAQDKKFLKKRKIADIFEEAEICMEEAVPKKIDEVRKMLMKGTKSAVVGNSREKRVPKEAPDHEDLSFKKSRVDVDTSLLETADEGISSGLSSVQKISDKVDKAALPKETKLPDIDPNKFIPVKTQKLRTVVPEFEECGDSESDEEEGQQRMNLMEAFADDDIADEFRREKEKAEEESKPKTVDLRLPGWGEWGGLGIQPTKKNRRQNKQVLRFPGAPRKDHGKKFLIINDDPPASFKKKQVDDLPSEFPSVAAYESSIRAPIGSTWVPQAAHNALTAAPVVTKMGAIIQSLDDSHLIKEDAEQEAQKKFNDSIKSGRPASRFKRNASKPAGHAKHKAGKSAGYSNPEGGHKKNFDPAKKRKAGRINI